jgi:ubiquitin-like 1-activating enzyme E1 A
MSDKRKIRSTSPIREEDKSAEDTHLTDEEARIYDRQLRIWGMEAQKRMRSASILIMGNFGGVAAEIAKNVVLAGIGSVTIADDTPVRIPTSPT